MNWRLGCLVMIALGCVGLGLIVLVARYVDMKMDEGAYYATHADAVAKGAMGRRWLPEHIPHSATNIQESYNRDSDEQWMRLDCDPADLPALTSKFTPISVENAQFPWARSTRKREWWPIELTEATPDTEKLYDLHTNAPDTYMAIEKGRPRVWLWRIGNMAGHG